MTRRNKARVFLAMPLAVFIWFIGWALTYIGCKNENQATKYVKKDTLSFAVMPFEQEASPRIVS